jgi:hypothetical protein
MSATSLKAAVVGGIAGAVMAVGTVAVAGNGIGGVFNLGTVNTVGATTTLTGATAGGPQLQVTNTSTTGAATGLAVTTAAGKPPLTVSNNVLNRRLNAQFLSGFAANGLGRVGLGSVSNLIGISTTTAQARVSITAPAKGFVRLDGTITAYDAFSSSFCVDCAVYVLRRDARDVDGNPGEVGLSGQRRRRAHLFNEHGASHRERRRLRPLQSGSDRAVRPLRSDGFADLARPDGGRCRQAQTGSGRQVIAIQGANHLKAGGCTGRSGISRVGGRP